MKKCPYCAEEIQDEAILCKHCRKDLTHPHEMKAQVIEKTSKKYKGMQAFGCVGTIVCVLLLMGLGASGGGAPGYAELVIILLTIAMLGIYVLAKVGAWWNHG